MLALLKSRSTMLCDVCGYDVSLERGRAVSSQASGPAHTPQTLICCGESCLILAEDRLTAKPLRQMSLRQVLEALLRA